MLIHWTIHCQSIQHFIFYFRFPWSYCTSEETKPPRRHHTGIGSSNNPRHGDDQELSPTWARPFHVRARLTHEFPFKLECLKGLLLNVNLWHMIMWKKHFGGTSRHPHPQPAHQQRTLLLLTGSRAFEADEQQPALSVCLSGCLAVCLWAAVVELYPMTTTTNYH